ncbi:MAG: hypothetical protein IKE55_06750, partial [Kiritimatiellae bacterium]|nr:hypothetical protein [Kiritimatiellia bacterium]
WKRGEILPKKDSSCPSSFAAIVVSYMALPFLLVFSTSHYSEDQHRKATLFSENRLKTAQASATHRQRRKKWGTSNSGGG